MMQLFIIIITYYYRSISEIAAAVAASAAAFWTKYEIPKLIKFNFNFNINKLRRNFNGFIGNNVNCEMQSIRNFEIENVRAS